MGLHALGFARKRFEAELKVEGPKWERVVREVRRA